MRYNKHGDNMEKAKVYFTSKITKENMVEIFKKLNIELEGKVAVKVHSGEAGNQNYLRPEFLSDIINYVNGTVVECNTAYEGKRNTTEKHLELMKEHKWSDLYNVDILDAVSEDVLEISNGKVIKNNYVGSNMKNYDSMLVISHFKGHPMGGYGGALKNISIGLASSHGKAYIHGAGYPEKIWTQKQELFLESMADAASSIVDKYKDKIAFINVMCNMSVDCDCCAKAEDPCMADIGILASADPIALDQACIDLVYASTDPGRDHLLERIESKNGVHIIEAASLLDFGSREYELINID